MAKLRLDIPDDTYERLVALAANQRRTPELQAEWTLMQAVNEWWDKQHDVGKAFPQGTAGSCPLS
jgi:predicted transcriptional regulator